MSGLFDILEDFGSASFRARSDGPVIDEGEMEASRLAAFEEGYRAGWDDADKARKTESGELSQALAQNLQDLSFTYHEAYGTVMSAVAPLLEDMVNAFLPQLAQATIGAHVVETLRSLSAEIGSLEVTLSVAPVNLDAVSPLIDGDFAFPVKLTPDETLGPDQADLRFGQVEKQIDLGDLVETVREAVRGFAHDNKRTLANG